MHKHLAQVGQSAKLLLAKGMLPATDGRQQDTLLHYVFTEYLGSYVQPSSCSVP